MHVDFYKQIVVYLFKEEKDLLNKHQDFLGHIYLNTLQCMLQKKNGL